MKNKPNHRLKLKKNGEERKEWGRGESTQSFFLVKNYKTGKYYGHVSGSNTWTDRKNATEFRIAGPIIENIKKHNIPDCEVVGVFFNKDYTKVVWSSKPE